MMTILDWLSNIAWKKPRTLAIIILVAGTIILTRVIVYQQNRIVDLETTNRNITKEANQRIDSLTLAFSLKEERMNAETKATLNSVIEDYKSQLKEQRDITRRVNNSIIEANRTLKDNEEKLKQLSNVN
jgi:3-methyladenine DNA glycosylase/8-oxoguanine DNA glycosylase